MRIPIIALILLQTAALRGAEIVWTNTSGGLWSTAANWSPNKVPASTDTAFITNSGTYGVNINAGVTVGSLVLGGDSGTQTLTNASGTLNAVFGGTVTANGRFILSGGTLGGTNPLAVAGTMIWTAGSLGNSASANVQTGGWLTVSGSTVKSFQGAITNAGTVVYAPTGSGYLNFVGGVIHNLAGGVCEMQTDNQFNDGGGANLIVNEGTLRQLALSSSFTNEIPLLNHGVVDVPSGVLRMTRGGTLATGSLFSGAGQTLLVSGTYTLAGAVVSTNLVLAGGTLNGTGRLSGAATWNQGPLTGDLTIAADGVLTISGTGTRSISGGSLTNAGTVVFATAGAGYLTCVSSVMHTLAGGVCEVQTDSQFKNSGGSPLLVNEGTLRRTTSSGPFTNDILFVNRGFVDVQTGTLRLSRGGTLGAGSVFGGAGATLLVGGTYTLAGAVMSTNLVLLGSTLSGSGSLSGSATWSQGTVNGDLRIEADGALMLSGTGTKTLSAGSLTNAGIVVCATTGTGYLTFISSVMHTLPGGVCVVQSDSRFDTGGGANLMVNEGTLQRVASTGTFTNEIPFMSRSTVDAQMGDIRMTGGGTLGAGSVFTGAGQAVLASGTFNLDGTIATSNLVLDGATLGGTGGFDGSLIWIGGTISGSVDLNIPPSGKLVLLGTDAKTVIGSITNNGTITYASSNSFTLFRTVHNRAGGLLEIWNDQPIKAGASSSLVVNEGTVQKRAGAGTTTNNITWINRGVLDIQSGTLRLTAGGELGTGSAFTGSGQTVLAGGTFNLGGTISSENLVLDGATLGGSGGFNGSLTWIGGAISGSVDLTIPANGRLLLLGASPKSLIGAVTNAGTITYASSNYFTLYQTLHNQPGGLFEIWNDQQINRGSSAARIINEGIIRKLAGFGTTTNEIVTANSGSIEAVSGTLRFASSFVQSLAGNLTFQLGGTGSGSYGQIAFASRPTFNGSLSVQRAFGYLPAAGDSFAIMNFPACDTDFRCWDGLYLLGHNLRLEPQWGTTTLTLATVAVPDPTSIPVRVTVEGEALVCWPSEFGNYQLYANTNLATTNWALLPGVTNRFVDRPLAPEKFFRIAKP